MKWRGRGGRLPRHAACRVCANSATFLSWARICARVEPAGNASVPFTATTQKLTATVDKPAPVAPPAAATVDGATVNGSVNTATESPSQNGGNRDSAEV